jgi:large subunit ribosomal protein L13
MNTTVRIKASEIYKDWHVIDAAGRPLGRVASEAAILLRGKHKPTYEPHLDDGDFVVIINAGLVKMTGRKAEQNKYYTHSGYPGGLRTRTFADQFARYPERVVERAVWGMLPGGTLGEAMLKHLKVYRGAHHPHQSQITGSERSRAARSEAQAAALGEPMKAPRLRTLSVPAVIVAPEPKAKPVVAPAAAVAEKPKRRKAPTEAVAATDVAEKPKRRKAPSEAVAATDVAKKPKRRKAPTEAVAATDVPAETVSASEVTQAEPNVAPARRVTPPEAAVAAEKKPRRTKASTAEASAMKVAEAAAKPRARRKAASPAAEAAAATETPKPARKRASPKIEE